VLGTSQVIVQFSSLQRSAARARTGGLKAQWGKLAISTRVALESAGQRIEPDKAVADWKSIPRGSASEGTGDTERLGGPHRLSRKPGLEPARRNIGRRKKWRNE
jgi:hypothetical protein